MTSNIWHCFCSYSTKEQGANYISALSCHTASCRHTGIGCKTKYETKTKLQDQDQGRSETGLVIRPRF